MTPDIAMFQEVGAVEKYKFPLFAKKVYTNVTRKPLYRMLQFRYTAQQLNQGDRMMEKILRI